MNRKAFKRGLEPVQDYLEVYTFCITYTINSSTTTVLNEWALYTVFSQQQQKAIENQIFSICGWCSKKKTK